MSLRPPPVGYWALAGTLAQLRLELVAGWPAVPWSAYGTIGDAAHQARHSDHNPDQRGYVRALDVPYTEHGGPPLELLALLLQKVGQAESRRLNPGGYVIWNRRVASARSQWNWTPYTGPSPHTDHLHVSCSLLPPFYDLGNRWNVVRELGKLGQHQGA
jgi:hypothetical protein